jgi:cell division protein FtsL
MYNRVLGGSRIEIDTRPLAATVPDQSYALRTLPNEDVYFFVKEINNSRVVRQADPKERSAAWKTLVSAAAVVTLLVGVLLPSAYGLLAGYKVEALKAEQQALMREKSRLELEESSLLNPARLEELARIQSFVDPAPQKVVYLDPKAGSLAMNVKK